jgi:MinD superfamily P-loop ATPase
MSPPIIREVKKLIRPGYISLIDAPPGTSCPVVESVKGSDFTLLVTEPTPFGLNDLRLAVDTLRQLKIPFGVIINRDGLGDPGVQNYCRDEGISILMIIPMERRIAVAYSQGKPLIDIFPAYKKKFTELYESIQRKIS